MTDKRVLWVSRHEMTPCQFADLERVLGGPVELVHWKDTVRSPEDLREALQDVDAAAVVLPPELLGEILRMASGKPVLRSVAGREKSGRTLTLPDGRQEAEFIFVHKGWEQILKADFQTRRLSFGS